jgi:hypothetical protein
LVDAGEIDEAIQPLPLSLSNGQTSLWTMAMQRPW